MQSHWQAVHKMNKLEDEAKKKKKHKTVCILTGRNYLMSEIDDFISAMKNTQNLLRTHKHTSILETNELRIFADRFSTHAFDKTIPVSFAISKSRFYGFTSRPHAITENSLQFASNAPFYLLYICHNVAWDALYELSRCCLSIDFNRRSKIIVWNTF